MLARVRVPEICNGAGVILGVEVATKVRLGGATATCRYHRGRMSFVFSLSLTGSGKLRNGIPWKNSLTCSRATEFRRTCQELNLLASLNLLGDFKQGEAQYQRFKISGSLRNSSGLK